MEKPLLARRFSRSQSPGLHTTQEGFWLTPPYINPLDFLVVSQNFSTLHRFSAGLRSGELPSQSMTSMCFFPLFSWWYVWVAVMLEWPIFSVVAEERRFETDWMSHSTQPVTGSHNSGRFAENKLLFTLFPSMTAKNNYIIFSVITW